MQSITQTAAVRECLAWLKKDTAEPLLLARRQGEQDKMGGTQ